MSSFSLEEVNSIEDVPEALQIATVVKETYYDITGHKDWEFLNKTFSLDASGASTKPVLMSIPFRVADIDFIKYLDEKDNKYKPITYLNPEDFINLVTERQLSSNIQEVSGVVAQVSAKFKVYNDRQPTYFTSFDEKNIVFDAFNSTYDTTLQANKTLCKGTVIPTFLLEDSYEIEMPEEMVWSYLLPEVKSVASINLLQTANQKEEQRSRRGRHRMYHAHPKTTDDYRRRVDRYGRK